MLCSDLCPGASRDVKFLDDSVSLLISSFDKIRALFEPRLAESPQINIVYICIYVPAFSVCSQAKRSLILLEVRPEAARHCSIGKKGGVEYLLRWVYGVPFFAVLAVLWCHDELLLVLIFAVDIPSATSLSVVT